MEEAYYFRECQTNLCLEFVLPRTNLLYKVTSINAVITSQGHELLQANNGVIGMICTMPQSIIDYIVRLDKFRVVVSNRMDSDKFAGGKGINVSRY